MKPVAKNYLFFSYFMYKYDSYANNLHAALYTKKQQQQQQQNTS